MPIQEKLLFPSYTSRDIVQRIIDDCRVLVDRLKNEESSTAEQAIQLALLSGHLDALKESLAVLTTRVTAIETSEDYNLTP